MYVWVGRRVGHHTLRPAMAATERGLCKGRAVQLADKLAQLGVRAAAEEHLAPLWCVLLAVLVCLRAFTFAIACPHPALNHFTFSMFFVDVFSVPPLLASSSVPEPLAVAVIVLKPMPN